MFTIYFMIEPSKIYNNAHEKPITVRKNLGLYTTIGEQLSMTGIHFSIDLVYNSKKTII